MPDLDKDMKCYLINLDRSKDRLAKMQLQFDSYNIQFTRVAAVDGRLLTSEQLAEVVASEQKWEIPLPASEIGCFLSHKKCLELIADGEDEYSAIFEDDVTFSKDISIFLNNTDWIPKHSDVIKIDTDDILVALKDFNAIKNTEYELPKLCSKHLCCGGYIVSRNAAKRILTHMDKISVPVDNLIYDPKYKLFSKLKIHQVLPALCMQIYTDSLIEADRQHLRIKHKKRPTFLEWVGRELMRPYKRNAHIISPVNIWARWTTSTRWMKVPFKR